MNAASAPSVRASLSNDYRSSPRSTPAPLAPQQRPSRPASVTSHVSSRFPMAATSSRSPAQISQSLPPNRPPSSQHSQRGPVSRGNTPKPVQPLHISSKRGDDVSTHSGQHFDGANTPRQSYQNLPATNGQGGGTTRSDASQHRRVVSESHLSPGPSHAGLPPTDGEHTLHRIGSNVSMRSENSQYSRYDGSKYLDPAYFAALAPNTDKGKGVDRSQVSPSPRPPSVSSALSYVTSKRGD